MSVEVSAGPVAPATQRTSRRAAGLAWVLGFDTPWRGRVAASDGGSAKEEVECDSCEGATPVTSLLRHFATLSGGVGVAGTNSGCRNRSDMAFRRALYVVVDTGVPRGGAKRDPKSYEPTSQRGELEMPPPQMSRSTKETVLIPASNREVTSNGPVWWIATQPSEKSWVRFEMLPSA